MSKLLGREFPLGFLKTGYSDFEDSLRSLMWMSNLGAENGNSFKSGDAERTVARDLSSQLLSSRAL